LIIYLSIISLSITGASPHDSRYAVKFKSPRWVQNTLSLRGKIRNIFAVDVGRYTKNASEQRSAFQVAKEIWNEAAIRILHA